MKRFAIRQLAAATALLFTLGATPASAQDGPRPGHGPLMRLMRVLSRLDLTESQKSQVRQILASRRATFESLRDKARTDREALRAAAEVASPDAETVGAAFLKLRSDREAIRAERNATLDQIRSILTPEQRERFDSMIEAWKERFHRRIGR